MKKMLPFFLFLITLAAAGQDKGFRFAFVSDTHIGSPNGDAEEDLKRTVEEINSQPDLAFVVVTGDITELGTDRELARAHSILGKLKVKYYIIPGNHGTGWSESGGLSFSKVFGADRFHFVHNGIHFLGCASGPYVRMSDGHVPRDAVNWLRKELDGIGKKEPVIFLNHYPLDNGLDNWYEVLGLLKKKNTIAALCGHGHANRVLSFEDVPGVMGRSNLRAEAPAGGYNLVTVRPDSLLFTERNGGMDEERTWTGISAGPRSYDRTKSFPLPDFSPNKTYPNVSATWTFRSEANVISIPAVVAGQVVFGNQNGLVQSLRLRNGKKNWSFQTEGPIFSSPAAHRGKIVLGSADGFVYCLSTGGKLLWKAETGASVLGSPLIGEDLVYIGGSDHRFRALDLETGKERWAFDGLGGPVVSKPVVYKNLVLFGAWDRHLYALHKKTGTLAWKWHNGSPVLKYSPAACIPVVKDDVVYIAAPDRYLTAIDAPSGRTLWRTNESTVRESIGISEDGKWIYGKTMNDSVAAFFTGREKGQAAWKLHAAYGHGHAPSMLIEWEGTLYFGTRNGLVYAVDPLRQKVSWVYKLDNSMVPTVQVLEGRKVVAATMDGTVSLLEAAD